MPAQFKGLTLEALDHQALADWWCAALGYGRFDSRTGQERRPREWPIPLHDPSGAGPLIWVSPVTAPRSEGGRVRLDVCGNTEELLGLGATLVRRRNRTADWDVLADPEGNEFAVFPPGRPGPH